MNKIQTSCSLCYNYHCFTGHVKEIFEYSNKRGWASRASPPPNKSVPPFGKDDWPWLLLRSCRSCQNTLGLELRHFIGILDHLQNSGSSPFWYLPFGLPGIPPFLFLIPIFVPQYFYTIIRIPFSSSSELLRTHRCASYMLPETSVRALHYSTMLLPVNLTKSPLDCKLQEGKK